MFCTNCGSDLPEGISFCTSCGAAVPVGAPSPDADTAAFGGVTMESLGSSLEEAVAANEQEMGSIEARVQAREQAQARIQAQEQAAAAQVPPSAQGGVGETEMQPPAQPGEAPGSAAGFPPPPAAYRSSASPNAHYSSQRSYEGSAYGQDTGQEQRRQPPYGAPQAQREFPQPATSRAFAMVLYIANLIGVVIALCVRDKDDDFITHHLNNALVICIGCIVATMFALVLIGWLLFIYLLVMTIMGMVSAYNGDTRELPLIGKIRIIK